MNLKLKLLVKNKKFKNVLVVLGGTSGERAISLESGRACIKALKKKDYKVSSFDPKIQNFNLINKKKVDVILLNNSCVESGNVVGVVSSIEMPCRLCFST